MSWHVIPLDTTPDQEFFVSVDVGGRNVYLLLHLRYNTEGRFWKMDVSDGTTREMLISGVPLVTGLAPLRRPDEAVPPPGHRQRRGRSGHRRRR